MKQLARIFCIALMAIGCCSAFAGCGNKTTPGEIVVLMNRTDLRTTVLADAKEQFDAEFAEQGWTVTFETTTDYEGDTSTRLLGGEYGDVLLIPNSVKGEEFAYYFMPLGSTEELAKEWRFVNSKAYDGQVYGLSTYGSTTGVLYNKKVFAEAGITDMPSTPDEFLAAMRTLKSANADNPNFVPYYTNFAAEWPLDQWTDAVIPATGNANYLVDELPWDTGAFAPGGACYTVYELLYNLVKEGLTEQSPSTTEWERSKVELVNGNIGAMVLGSWAIPQFQEVAGGKAPGDLVLQPGEITGAVEDIGYMPFPFEVDGKMYATSASDYTLGIANNTRNEEAARAFIEWFLTDFGYYKMCGGIPPQLSNDDFPDAITAFEEMGVTFLEQTAARVEGAQELCEEESGITMWASAWKKPFVEEAYKVREGQGGKTYAEICADLNEQWNEGVAAVIEEFGPKA